MSDNINSLDYLWSKDEDSENLINRFNRLSELLTEYSNDIFMSFVDVSDYDLQISNELWLIKESIRPIRIFNEGYSLIVSITENISEMKEANKNSWSFRFQDTNNIIKEIIYEYWYDYKLKQDNRMKEFDNPRETQAYKAIRDALQKLLDENNNQWVEISFHESWTPGNFINIHYCLSEKVLNNTEPENSESSEIIDEVPELESENYKIDIHLSVEEKLQNWRIKEIDTNGIVFLRKDLWWSAYVCEYLEWIPSLYIWEQKFNFFAVSKLWLKSKCMKDKEEAEENLWNLSKPDIEKKHKLSGRYNSKENTIEDINCWNNYRLGDWNLVWISENFEIFYSGDHSNTAHSLRLVKGR